MCDGLKTGVCDGLSVETCDGCKVFVCKEGWEEEGRGLCDGVAMCYGSFVERREVCARKWYCSALRILMRVVKR